jgi:hypothetical protein
VHRAFFSPEYPVAEVKKFEKLMPEYESLVWLMGMMFSFVDVENVMENIVGWSNERQERISVIAGEKDTLMGIELMRQMAAEYRQAFINFAKNLWSGRSEDKGRDHVIARREVQHGVQFEIIQSSGHHIQNDLHWDECARKILLFLDRL